MTLRALKRARSLFVLLPFVATAACAANTSVGAGGDAHPASKNEDSAKKEPAKEADKPAPTPAPTATAPVSDNKNPYGVDYPTKNLGTAVGKIIKNLKFQGYPAPDGVLDTSDLKEVQLANFFDPDDHFNIKVLHITVVSLWSDSARSEMRFLVDENAQVPGVTNLVAIAQSEAMGDPSTPADLTSWVEEYKPKFSVVLDPDLKQLEPFGDNSAPAFSIDINARTMGILAIHAEPHESMAALRADLVAQVDYVDSH